MANDTRNFDLNFQTNAEQIKAKVDQLTASLDTQSEEYVQLTEAARKLADAEFQLIRAQTALADASDHTASSQENLRNNLTAAQQNYNSSATSVNALATKIEGASANTTRFTESVRNNGRAAEQIKAKVDQLTASLDTQSEEYVQLTEAAGQLADAEFQLIKAQTALVDASDHTASSQENLRNNLTAAQQNYNTSAAAAGQLADAEFQLIRAQTALADASDHTASSQENLRNNLTAAQQNYNSSATSVNALTTRIQGASVNTTRFTESVRSNGRAVLDNGGAISILDGFTGGLATTIKDSVEALGLFTGGTEAASGGVKAFGLATKSALVASGIGLLIVAVGTLVAYWDDIKGLVNGVNREMGDQNKLAQKNVDASQEQLDILNGQDNILKLQGKSEKEILNIKMNQTAETIKSLEVLLASQKAIKQAQVEAAQRNKDILSGILKFISIPITALLYAVDEVGKAFGKNFNLVGSFDKVANLVFDPKKVGEEGDKTIKETEKKLLALKNTQAGYQLGIKDIDKKAAEDRAAKRKENDDAEKKAAEEKAKFLLKSAMDLQDQLADTEQKKLDLRKEREKKALDDQIKALKLNKDEELKVRKEFNDKFALLQSDVDAKEKARLEKEAADKKKAEEDKAKTELDYWAAESEKAVQKDEEQKEKDELEKQAFIDKYNYLSAAFQQYSEAFEEGSYEQMALTEASMQLEKIAADGKISNMELVEAGLSVAVEALGKHTAAGKAAAIAEATINTYKMATSSYSALSGIPIVGPALGAVAAGVAVAAGIANVKKILSVKAPGSAGGSAPSGTGTGGYSAGTAPNVNFIASSENQVASTINQNQRDQAPIKAYVVASEMTEQQTIDTKLADQNTL